MRFAEIALLALPFVVFVAWRILAPSAGPPRSLVIAVTVTVVAMVGLLLAVWYEEAEPPGVGYVPARLEDGRVVPERTEPRVPDSSAPSGAAAGASAGSPKASPMVAPSGSPPAGTLPSGPSMSGLSSSGSAPAGSAPTGLPRSEAPTGPASK